MSGLAFMNPWILLALAALPAIWWLLRTTPPSPQRVRFPAVRLLKGLVQRRQTPARSPWWLTLIRMLAATLVILALAEPVLNASTQSGTGSGPLAIVVDNGWPAAAHWSERQQMLTVLIDEAERDGRPVIVVPTAADGTATPVLEAPQDARARIVALTPSPLAPDRMKAAAALAAAGATPGEVAWLSDGIDHGSGRDFAAKLVEIAGGGGAVTVLLPTADGVPIALRHIRAGSGALKAEVLSPGGLSRDGIVVALSSRGDRLSEAAFSLSPTDTLESFTFDLPLELRNQVSRMEILGERSAGAIQLADAGTRWNRIGLVSGASREKAQPLLSPLHYLERSLGPFAELVKDDAASQESPVDSLLKQGVTVLILADIGKLVGGTLEATEKWIEGGGVLVRFAGPRLEQGGDELMPVALRAGGRSLGGALSWSEPQPLAPFDETSIFAGLTIPPDVRVNRQVLADPALLGDETLVWARLSDGTPLVTATKRKQGYLILFHVTANTDWSNLPISGLFVDMLQRVTALTGLAEIEGGQTVSGASSDGERLLAPVQTLNGFGELGPPPATVRPLPIEGEGISEPDAEHPPGFYGPPGKLRALNAVGPKFKLEPLPSMPAGVVTAAYRGAEATELKPDFLSIALLLVFLDVAAVLLLQLGLVRRWARRSAAATLFGLALASALLLPAEGRAQTTSATHSFALEAALHSRLAHVLTGDAETDEVAQRGLQGLTAILLARTAYEPAEPLGVDVERDELTFFPVLYWPIRPDARELSDAAVAKVDSYLKNGGMIVFDTRDALEALPQIGGLTSTGTEALRRVVGRLDIPALAPAPPEHVVTKSFYLLKSFPGRYDTSPLWVESDPTADEDAGQGRRIDGVSSILITSNDLAGAWAIDDNATPLYAVVPGGEEQREYAYRVGVNIVMYALTGNYKADQVHVPALLERLGQ
ncbi:MAG: DUF4159 domain-containing protein [Hyphomicrobiaceae bacterium]